MESEVGKVLAQCWVFRLRLLNSVFTEEAMTGSERVTDRFRRMGLADGDKVNARRRPPGSGRDRRNPAADRGEIDGDNPFHSASIPGNSFILCLRTRGC